VVGYSTGSKPKSLRSRRIATSCTAGNIPGAANEGETTATRSPAVNFAGTVNSGRMTTFKGITRADDPDVKQHNSHDHELRLEH
jgi:hypothetical protein